MEGTLTEGALGSVGKYDVKFEQGKLVVEVMASASVGDVGLVAKVDAEKVLDALAAAIPGKIDDAVFGLIKAALKA